MESPRTPMPIERSGPCPPRPHLAGSYGIALGRRRFHAPIGIPRLAATLPIPAAAITRAKVAWVAAWAVVFVGIPLAFAAVRLL